MKRSTGTFCRAIACTILDERKGATILDSTRVYLKGTRFFVTRGSNSKRARTYKAWDSTNTHGTTNTSILKIMFWICRGYPWNKGLGLSDVAQGIDVIFLAET